MHPFQIADLSDNDNNNIDVNSIKNESTKKSVSTKREYRF